jgi:hypothetical protein
LPVAGSVTPGLRFRGEGRPTEVAEEICSVIAGRGGEITTLRIIVALALALAAVAAPHYTESKEKPHIRVVVETIPHSRQAYDTVGDWRSRKAPGKRGPVEL